MRLDADDRTRNPEQWWQRRGERDPFRAIAEVMADARKTFPAAFSQSAPVFTNTERLQHRFAGLVMLSDWLGSDERHFPGDRPRDFDPWMAASAACASVGIDPSGPRRFMSERPFRFEEAFDFPPNPLQSAIAATPTSDANSRLLIIESETVSGKTEAALSRFFYLFSLGEVDSLYFALPTRVAAREVYKRILGSVERVFPDPTDRPPVLLAVPGYARVDGVQTNGVLPKETDENGEEPSSRLWAAERPKRFLAAPIAVGTIDQALLSAVQIKHAHLRSVCLDRSFLVIDEVHASDAYMRRLSVSLVQHHLSVGSQAVLLSATLGSAARAAYAACSVPGHRRGLPGSVPLDNGSGRRFQAARGATGGAKAEKGHSGSIACLLGTGAGGASAGRRFACGCPDTGHPQHRW